MAPPDTNTLTPTTLHVLLALAEGPQHGYAILKQAEKLAQGARPMGAGTLYAILKRLLEGGLIAESDDRPSDTDGRRRYYTLTDQGAEVARNELQRLEAVVDFGRSRRLLADTGEGR